MPSISLLSSIILIIIFSFSLISASNSHLSPPRATRINCGATTASVIDDQQWLPDTDDYVSSGVSKTLTTPDLLPILSTVRTFPLGDGTRRRKFCYVVPVFRRVKYLVRTTYYYGGVNGDEVPVPPVFDQIVDGTIWSVVNTTEDYGKGLSSYYEGVFLARGRSMSVCVGVNSYTDSDPFISALEFVILGDSVYNSTDFRSYGLSLVARNSFGYEGPIIRFPDDQFDRFWEPFGDEDPVTRSIRNVSATGFWNLPPSKVFDTQMTTDQARPMELQWPPVSLPNSVYYIALYFADNHDFSVEKPRIFDITVNGIAYRHNLEVTPTGVTVFATRWPLSGLTNITLAPAAGSDVGPLISAGEIFSVLSLGGRTVTRDVIALERVRNSLQNPPLDWNGDPCIPPEYSWTGVTCSKGNQTRVVALNLSGMGLSGSLSPSIAKMTALTDIWLGNNNLSGSIPDISPLRRLQTLHLENNQLTGAVPPSIGTIISLRELSIENNYLTGEVPNSLKGKPGLNLTISPGNRFFA